MRALSLISVVALLLGIAGSSADSSIPSPKSSVSVTKTSSTEKSLKNSRKGHSNNKNLTPTKDKIDSNRNKKILKKSKRFYHKIPKDIEEIPVAVNDQNITFQLVLRSIFLFMVFTPIILTSGLAYISVFFRTYVWYRMITLGITAGGAAFIKWGQWASTRPDMFPETFCALLSELQSNAPVHGFAYTQRLVWEQLGQPIEEVFDSFPRTPIASGSVSIFSGILLYTYSHLFIHPSSNNAIISLSIL